MRAWIPSLNSAAASDEATDPRASGPNLESVVKKTLRTQGRQAEYFGAINVAGINAAAQGLQGQAT